MRIPCCSAKQLGVLLGFVSINARNPLSPFSSSYDPLHSVTAFVPTLRRSCHHCHPRIRFHLFSLDASESSAKPGEPSMPTRTSTSQSSGLLFLSTVSSTIKLATWSLLAAVTIIAWEDISNTHPTRSYLQTITVQHQHQPHFTLNLASTVRGLAFGNEERQQMISRDGLETIEPESTLTNILSYNEVMLNHRTRRVAKWNQEITRQDVEDSVRQLQLVLLHVLKCEKLVSDYDWEEVSKVLRDPIILTQFDDACDILNRANGFLSLEARSEVGFDFGSCAWRHCGAFADVREAIDELDHLVGILEPFEASFVLDVAERGLRDMLAVTTSYQDKMISIPEYQPLQRKSDVDGAIESFDVDYMEALEFFKKLEDTEAQGLQSP